MQCTLHVHSEHIFDFQGWKSLPEFQLFDSPQGHSRDLSKFREKMFLCIVPYNHALQIWPCPPFYLKSVCPELARNRLQMAQCSISAFHGGLQARLWQAKIDLWSVVMQFPQAAHRVARQNLLALWEVHRAVLGLRVCMKQIQRKEPCRIIWGDQLKDVSKIDQRKSYPRKKNW